MDVEAQHCPNRLPQMMSKYIQADIRRGFVFKVYGILSVQLLVTALVAAPLTMATPAWIAKNVWLMWFCLAVYAALACVVCAARPLLRSFPLNYGVLFGLTLALAVMVGFVSAQYTWQSVVLAAGFTAIVFLGLTAYAFFSKSDFTGFRPYLFTALMVLLVFGMGISVMSFCGVAVAPLILLYDVLGAMLFSFFIVYDTQLIIGEWGGHKHQFAIDDYCLAALQLYLDIVELFLLILEMLGDRKK